MSTLIYKTAMNDIKKRRRPDLDIWKGLGGHSSDEDLAWSREIIFGIESGAYLDRFRDDGKLSLLSTFHFKTPKCARFS